MSEKTSIERLVDELRTLADALEGIKDEHPDLTWYELWNTTPWNPLLPMPGITAAIDVRADMSNLGKATVIRKRTNRVWWMTAYRELHVGSRVILIPVFQFDGIQHAIDFQLDKVLKVAELLTEEPRRELSRLIQRRIRDRKKRAAAKKAKLIKQLKELLANGDTSQDEGLYS